MILVQTTIPIDSDHREQALELCEMVTEHSRSEDGAIEYWAGTDISEPNVVHFFERYESETALDSHSNTDHYRTLVDRLPQLTDGQIRTTTFETEPPETVAFDAEDAA